MSPEFNEVYGDRPSESIESNSPDEGSQISYPHWKEDLRRSFEAWLSAVETVPDFEEGTEKEPDLYSFYEQLAILNAESRKSNRRSAEAFSQWGSVLERFEADLRLFHDKIDRAPDSDSENGSLSKKHCLAFIELLDRLLRLQEAFNTLAPKRSWLKLGDAKWRKVWHAQQEACGILIAHFETLLAGEEVERIECLGCVFDPATMAAVAVERDPSRPSNSVLEEMARGYLWHGELLRCAQVKVNALPRSEDNKEGIFHE